MKKIIAVFCLMLMVGSCAIAMQPEVLGGVRDGLAVGIGAKQSIAKNVALRFGVEASTSKQPLILFFGGKFYLTSVGSSPMSLGAGAVAYSGSDKTDAGLSLSVIFDRFININPLYFEAGIDIAGTSRLLLQVGYIIY